MMLFSDILRVGLSLGKEGCVDICSAQMSIEVVLCTALILLIYCECSYGTTFVIHRNETQLFDTNLKEQIMNYGSDVGANCYRNLARVHMQGRRYVIGRNKYKIELCIYVNVHK